MLKIYYMSMSAGGQNISERGKLTDCAMWEKKGTEDKEVIVSESEVHPDPVTCSSSCRRD